VATFPLACRCQVFERYINISNWRNHGLGKIFIKAFQISNYGKKEDKGTVTEEMK